MPKKLIEYLKHIDNEWFITINNNWQNGFFDLLCPFMRTARNWIPVYGLLIYFMFSHFGKNSWWLLLTAAITVLVSDQISGNLIKHAVERLRPCNDPTLSSSVRLLVNCGSGYSFVSSHACNHFAVAVLLSRIFKTKFSWFMPVALVWAALISFSQVYVGVHFPLDGICGAFIGIGIGLAAVKVLNLYFTPFKADVTL